MNEERIGLYLELIEKLLSCPSGEEPGILQAHRELWDEDFVLTLQAVEGQWRENGQEAGAEFLLQVAEQLAELLGMEIGEHIVQDSFSFLMQVLQSVADSRGDSQVVYSVLAKNIAQLNDDFCQTLRNWGIDILPTVAPEQARSHGAVLSYLGNLIQQFPYGDQASKLEIAITAYELALIVFTRDFDAELWASIQNNLGVVYKDRINGSRSENLERSIQHYQSALTVRTRNDSSEDWAETQYNLGNTYLKRVQGDELDNLELASDNLELAINSYRLVLEVSSLEATSPKLWAMANTNIGGAYTKRIKGDRSENLEKAIKFSQAALTVHTFMAYPTDWAIAQKNLGGIYLERIKGERAENLEKAIEFCQGALKVYTPEAFPEDWKMVQNILVLAYVERVKENKAENLEGSIELQIELFEAVLVAKTFETFSEKWAETQYNLANVYQNRTKGDRAENLERSIRAYEAALTFYALEGFLEEWANTQNSLAIAYKDRINGSRAENLERSIRAYEAALTFYTLEGFPKEWAKITNSLAITYTKRIKGERADNIEIAIRLYQEALNVRTREASVEYWAETQNNLANVYLHRIEGEKAENIEIAISLYQANLNVFTPTAFPEDWAMTQNNLGVMYKARIKEDRAENLEKAIKFHEAALTIRTCEAFPEEWAETQHNLAIIYNDRIKGDRADNLEQAIKCYEKALIVFTKVAFPEPWARTQTNLAAAYTDRIEGKRADSLEIAIRLYQEALAVYTRKSYPENWARVIHNLANAYRDRIKDKQVDNLKKAIELYEECLSVRTFKAFPEKYAQTQNNLAIAYEKRSKIREEGWGEDIEQAILCYEKALTVYTSTKFPQYWAMTQRNLGNAYGDRVNGSPSENFKRAIELYQDALTIYNRREFPLDYLRTLSNFGTLYYQNQQWQNAYDMFAGAIETIAFLRGDIQSEENKQKLAEEWNMLYLGMVEVCIALELYPEAVEYAERSKGQNLIELLSVKDLYPKGEIPSEVRQELQSLKDRIYEEDQRLKQAPEKNYDLITQLRQQHAALYPYTPLKFPQIKKLTPASTALVEWYILGDSFCVFLITHNSEPRLLSFPKSDLDQLINWTGEYLEDYYTDREAWQNSLATKLANLAQILHIDEILQSLPKETTELILIPHRYLHLFPLHALPIRPETWQHFHPDNQNIPPHPHLLDCFDAGTHYAPSCQILHQVQKYPRGKFENFFGIQTPTPDLYEQIETDLGTFGVAKKQFTNAKIFKKTQATKANLLPLDPHTQKISQHPDLTQADSTLFFCHGIFDLRSPLNSRLQLADGDLTLGEIIEHLDLKNCHFVTLAACETGLVDFQNNTDEYIGLPSGFLLAGSTNVISTLWSVRADATALFMIKFHEQLKKQPNLALTLKQTQLWLRDSTIQDFRVWLATSQINGVMRREIDKYFQQEQQKPDNTQGENTKIYASPYFWAAFCVIGRGA